MGNRLKFFLLSLLAEHARGGDNVVGKNNKFSGKRIFNCCCSWFVVINIRLMSCQVLFPF